MIQRALEVLSNSAKDYLLGLPELLGTSKTAIKLSPVIFDNEKNKDQSEEDSLLMSLINDINIALIRLEVSQIFNK